MHEDDISFAHAEPAYSARQIVAVQGPEPADHAAHALNQARFGFRRENRRANFVSAMSVFPSRGYIPDVPVALFRHDQVAFAAQTAQGETVFRHRFARQSGDGRVVQPQREERLRALAGRDILRRDAGSGMKHVPQVVTERLHAIGNPFL